ncbi:hypothetical protein CH371_19880 [Leptospira wolffii]|uniref:Uncharacterized protein n=1 Tax=Leptospira wolffii TaxID=409998 RepID=A0A2M9Z6N4_9LEPT|nr:hypothetical protein CH371_19880 [Leptospira wolffii]
MGYATFASVTALAQQARAIANVGTPWSLGDMTTKSFIVLKGLKLGSFKDPFLLIIRKFL